MDPKDQAQVAWLRNQAFKDKCRSSSTSLLNLPASTSVHRPLFTMPATEFAIIDVETTHGDPMQGSIIEVAVIVHNGLRELDRWNTLVRTRQDIPPFIRRLTGITPAMLEQAPQFAQVAQSLKDSTEGRIMVAHNVRYDMTSIQHELARTGLSYHPDTLCTERLARRLIPNLTHYNLGDMCRHLSIGRGLEHRAAHDVQATLALLLRLISDHGLDQVLGSVVPWSEQRRA